MKHLLSKKIKITKTTKTAKASGIDCMLTCWGGCRYECGGCWTSSCRGHCSSFCGRVSW